MGFYVYIMASGPNGTLYTGQTNDLAKRAFEHREKAVKGFTARYDVTRLVWFENFEDRENAFRRERRIKEWKRAWKIRLIEADNPMWRDLYLDLNNLISFGGRVATLTSSRRRPGPKLNRQINRGRARCTAHLVLRPPLGSRPSPG